MMRGSPERPLAQAELPGACVSTPYGTCLLFEVEVPLRLALPSPMEAQARLSQALALVYGIGPAREAILTARGYTIFDLVRHPLFGQHAAFWAEALAQRNLSRLGQGICRWYSASHPLLLYLVALAEESELVFVDVESLGLSTLPVFLVGMGRVRLSAGRLVVRQFLARDLSEEMAVLAQTLAELPPKPLVLGYNSKAHDWRQLQARLAYYGLGDLPDAAHLDLLFFVRRLWSAVLGDCSLSQVERRVLGRTRALDIPSEHVPLYYEAFLHTQQPRYILPILAHNREDVVSAALLLGRVLEEHARGSFAA
ncbi:MAG: ribonuclease H-like domain-containing protein [Candidatus Bipolaricaulaceae bacterium]